MPQKIPATIVTGFLGAGKTTLIRHMLENAEGKRIALIINEFGDLGVDGDILKGCGDETCTEDDIMELSNGCICCTVADDFIPTMEALLARENAPDHIVIETSGLALPQPLVRAFNWPGISTKVTVDGVVTVVDGKAVTEGRFAHNVEAVDAQRAADEGLDHETPLSELFEDQVACADMIVVNKSDLLTAGEAADLTSKLKTDSRDGVQVIPATKGALPVGVLLGQGIGAESDLEARHEVHHHHITTMIIIMITMTTTIMITTIIITTITPTNTAMMSSKASRLSLAKSPTRTPMPNKLPTSSAPTISCA